MSNILDEYLVRLGSVVDQPSWNKFNLTLKYAENTVLSFTGKFASQFLKIEGSLVGLFAAAGAGIIAIADKTAMADQQYRLFGMRMLMTKDSARAMQMSMDELGASLDEIAYDPELNKRFQYLYEQNQKLSKTLGVGFDKNMVAIRGLRMEYKFFGDELEFVAMGAISKLFEKAGYGTDDLLGKLNQLSTEFISDIPKWSEDVSNMLLPAWQGFTETMSQTWDITKKLAHDFTFLTGVIGGDKSLETETTNFYQFSVAIGEVVGEVAIFTRALLDGIKVALTFAETIGNVLYRHKIPDFTQHIGKDGKTYFDIWNNGNNKTLDDYLEPIDPEISGNIKPKSTLSVPSDLKNSLSNPNFLKLLHGIAMTESGDRQFDINGNVIKGKPNSTEEIALGRFQILPSTAKSLGIDPNDDAQNSMGGAMYLRNLLNKYHGDVKAALKEYGGFKTADPTDYINKVERYGFQSGYNPAVSGDVTIQQLTINVPKDLHKDEWAGFVKKSFHDINKEAIVRGIAFNGAGAYQ